MIGKEQKCICSFLYMYMDSKNTHTLSYSESGCQLCELPKTFSFSYMFLSYIHLTSLLFIENNEEKGKPTVEFLSWFLAIRISRSNQEWSPQMIFSLLPPPWRLGPVLTGWGNKRLRILPCTCYSWLETGRLLQVGSRFISDVIWISLVRLRLLVGFKILRPCLTNYQKPAFSVLTSESPLVATINIHFSLTVLQVSFSSAGLTGLSWNCLQATDRVPICGMCLLTLQSRLMGQLLSVTLWRKAQDQNEWEKTPLLEACALNCHTDTSIHISLVKAINSQGQVQGQWGEMYSLPARKYGQVTWKINFMLLQGQNKKVKTIILSNHTNHT